MWLLSILFSDFRLSYPMKPLTPCFLCPPCWQVPKSREGWFSAESTPIIQPIGKITTESTVVCVFKYNARFVQQLIQNEEGGKRAFNCQVSIKIFLNMIKKRKLLKMMYCSVSDTDILRKMKSECSFQESNLRPSDY